MHLVITVNTNTLDVNADGAYIIHNITIGMSQYCVHDCNTRIKGVFVDMLS